MADFLVLREWSGSLTPGSGVARIAQGSIISDDTLDVEALVASGLRAIPVNTALAVLLQQGDRDLGDVVAAAVQQLYDAGGGDDDRVKVTVADTAPGFLAAKLLAGVGITLTTQNPGANESLLVGAPLPAGHIQGLHVENNAGTPLTIVDIDAGEAVSEDGSFLIVSPGTLVVDIEAAGLNGLDTGTVANAWYALWVIEDSAGVEPVGGLLSLSFTEGGLAFPTGYDVARRVGAVRTIGALTIRPFGQPKVEGRQRWTYWKNNLVIQTDGTATAYTNTSTSAAPRIAPSAVRQQIGQLTTKVGGASVLAASNVIPDGWNEAAGNNSWHVAVGVSSGADVTTNGVIVMPVGPSRVVRYLVAPAGDAEVTIVVKGWEDSL